MKKSIIALAVAGVLAAPLAAQAAPKVYGKMHINMGTVDNGSDDNFQVQSFASRVGVKGEHDLGNGLKATYKAEWQIDPDGNGGGTDEYTIHENGTDLNNDGDTTDVLTFEDNTDGTSGFSRRNMYAGIKGSFGEFRFGRHDTPLKMVQGKFDQFGDTLADLKNAGDQDGENRADNVLAYLGKSGNLSYAIALIPGEGDGVDAGDGVADTTSVSLAYKEGPLYIGIAADSYDDTAGADEDSLTRLVATYKFSDSQIGLLWQSGVEKPGSESDKEDWLGVSFKTKMGGNNTFKAQYITVEDEAATALESTLIGVGIEHKFSKTTKGYVLATSLEEEAGGTTTKELDSFSIGYVVKF